MAEGNKLLRTVFNTCEITWLRNPERSASKNALSILFRSNFTLERLKNL
jgi:hypothetical protein